MQKITCLIVFISLFSGCSDSTAPIVTESISHYDYEFYRGHNAAIAQFGDDSDSFVDLSNKKIILYASDSEYSHGYEDGYHKALDKIQSKNSSCPDIH